jgi:methylglyoxal synthase
MEARTSRGAPHAVRLAKVALHDRVAWTKKMDAGADPIQERRPFPSDEPAYARRRIGRQKRIALVAHDNKKRDLLEWVRFNRGTLSQHLLYATGTTGEIIQRTLGLQIVRLQSGPLGGDQQIGAKIAEGEIDFLIFFWDPLEPVPHDPDVKALLRIAVVWNIPIACNRASADFMISSVLMREEYERLLPDYEHYRRRIRGEQPG